MYTKQNPQGWWSGGAGGLGDGTKYGLSYCYLPLNMELHNTTLCYALPY